MSKKFTTEKDVLKAILSIKNYSNKKAYIKTILAFFIVIPAVIGITATLVIGYYTTHSATAKKIAEHQEFVKKGKQKLSDEFEKKEADFNKRLDPLLEQRAQMKMSTDMAMEYTYVDMQRKRDAHADSTNKYIEDMMNDLKAGKSHVTDDSIYNISSCVDDAKDKLFNLRSGIIAGQNLAKKYKEDVRRLESLSRIDNWDRAELEKKKAFIKDAEYQDPNATDAELMKQIFTTLEPNTNLGFCVQTAKKTISILVKYDDSYNLLFRLNDIKATADLLGIAKDIDWTIPFMVRDEEKKSQAIKDQVKACEYLAEMDKKYLALNGNKGLQYNIFRKYRNVAGYGSEASSDIKRCTEMGLYPENKVLQNLIKEWKEMVKQGAGNFKNFDEVERQIELETKRSKDELSIKWD